MHLALGIWKNGRMEGLGILNYSGYKYHGTFERNLPKGPGCFSFEGVYIQHGFYVNMRDPAFDYVSTEELALKNNPLPEEEDRSNPRGIVPIWRARYVTEYKTELLPPPPVPLPVKDSLDSLLDIIDYLQQQYKNEIGAGEAEEG